MRGSDIQQNTSFSTMSLEQRVSEDHPRCSIRRMANETLKRLDREPDTLYADVGRGSIPLEKLLRTQLLMVPYTIRSERQMVGQIDYKLLFRCLSMNDRENQL